MSSDKKQPIFVRTFKGTNVWDVKQFTGTQIVLGREGDIDFAIPDQSLSPIHAMIEEREPGKYFLCDLGSQSGTFINGQKIVDVQIWSGAEFTLGQVKIDFHIGVPKTRRAGGETVVTPLHGENTQFTKTPPPSEPLPTPHSQPVTAVPPSSPPQMPAQPPKKVPPPAKPLVAPPRSVPAAPMASMGSTVVGSLVQYAPAGPRKHPKKTFAPSSSANINESLKPGRGGVVEVVLVWKDRVLNTYHFDKTQLVRIGSHPENDIILPIFGSVRMSHPILKIEGTVNVLLTADMTGEVTLDGGIKSSFDELRQKGRLNASGAGYSYFLQQNELVKVNIGEGVVLVIRFVPNAPESRLTPFIDLSVNQLTALVIGLMGTALFLFYVFLYAPPPVEEEDEEEPKRVAQFFYKRPVEVVKLEDPTPATKSAQQTIKDKEVAPARGEEGASRDAKPNPNQSAKKIPTTDKAGKDKGIQPIQTAKKATDSPPKAPKDVTKSGVLGVFGTKGVQDQLNKATQGAGNLAGAARNARGEGAEAAGSGIVPGAGTREVGAGGQGTATVGISGIKTSGKGGGISGYGTGTLGAKKNATILAGGDDATFTGTIDKEAIRRVVQANLKQIKNCYERGLNRDPSLYGKIVIQWTIGPGGKVLEAGIKGTTMNSPEVESCAVARLRTWKFPEPPVNEVAVVSYPFVFQAQE
jgi:hypothetical protein